MNFKGMWGQSLASSRLQAQRLGKGMHRSPGLFQIPPQSSMPFPDSSDLPDLEPFPLLFSDQSPLCFLTFVSQSSHLYKVS